MGFGDVLSATPSVKRNWWLSRYQTFALAVLACWLLGVTLCAYQALYIPSAQLNMLAEAAHTVSLVTFPLWTSFQVVISWIAVFAGLTLLTSSRRVALTLACLIAISLGGLYYRLFHLEPGPQDVFYAARGYPVRIMGEFLLQSDDPSKAFLTVQSVNSQPYKGKALIRLNKKLTLPEAGSLVSLDGRLSKPDSSSIPGTFDERRYLASQGVTAVLHHLSDAQTVANQPVSTWGYLNRVLANARSHIAKTFRSALPTPLSEIVGGIVLGDQAIPLDKTVRQQFVQTGLIHLLAASGMNVAIVAGLLFMIGRFLALPRRMQLVLAMAGALAYAFLSGLSPSVLRATAMLEIALALKWLDKTLSNVAVLLLAVTALVLYQPDLITSVGFQLSVLTTLGIMSMISPLQRLLGFYCGEGVASVLLLPLIAQLWATPLLITYFNTLPLLGVILNILVVPLVTVLTCLGFTAGLLGLLFQAGGVWIAKLAYPFVWLLYWLVSFTSAWPWAQFQSASLSPLALLTCYLLLILIALGLNYPEKLKPVIKYFHSLMSRLSKLPRPRLLVAGVLLILALWLQGVNTNRVLAQISVLPINGRSVAFLLENGPGNVSMGNLLTSSPILLMPRSVTPWYSRRVVDHLRHRNIQKISTLYWLPDSSEFSVENRQQAVLALLSDRVRVDRVEDFPHNNPSGSVLSLLKGCPLQLRQIESGQGEGLRYQPLPKNLPQGRFLKMEAIASDDHQSVPLLWRVSGG